MNAKRINLATVVTLLVTFLMLGSERAFAATTWYVDSTLGTNTPGCGTAPGPAACKTIQFTINLPAVSPGDTIKVAAGPYPENVNVNKSLTLLGAQAGISPVPPSTRVFGSPPASQTEIRSHPFQ